MLVYFRFTNPLYDAFQYCVQAQPYEIFLVLREPRKGWEGGSSKCLFLLSRGGEREFDSFLRKHSAIRIR